MNLALCYNPCSLSVCFSGLGKGGGRGGGGRGGGGRGGSGRGGARGRGSTGSGGSSPGGKGGGYGGGGSAGSKLAKSIVGMVIGGLFFVGIVVAVILFLSSYLKRFCCRPKNLLSKRKMDSIINKHNIFRHKTLKESQTKSVSELQMYPPACDPAPEEMSIFNFGVEMKSFQRDSTIPIQSEQKVGEPRKEFSACDISYDPKREILHFSVLKSKSSYL